MKSVHIGMISVILEHCDVNILQTFFLFSIPLINNFANDKMFSNIDKPGRFKHTLCHASTCKKDKFCHICMNGHSFPAEPKAEGFHKFNQGIRSICRLNIIVYC